MTEKSSPNQPTQPAGDGNFDDVLAEYLRAIEAGVRPNHETLLGQHPAHAEELREFFANHDRIAKLAQPLVGPPLTPRSSAPLEKIRYFGDYELIEEIGRGGMGVIYKARQTSLNRVVAVKMLLEGAHGSRHDLDRFRLEAEAAAGLDHPHIVPIYEVGAHDGRHYFSMKLVEGGNLAQRIANGPLQARDSVRLMAQVAYAVHYAHQHGILHRDLKPSNILLDVAGEPVVTDFGLAKHFDRETELTQTGAVLGTPSYMAPEQASGQSRNLTTATDVYGLGAVLYALLSGRPPFVGESSLDILAKVRELDPARLTGLNSQVDRDLDTICLKCLEKEPTRRFHTAAELAADLERWLNGEPISARPAGSLRRTLMWAKRRPAALSAAAALLLAFTILMGSIGWIVRDRQVRQAKRAGDLLIALERAELYHDQAKRAEALAAYERAEQLSDADEIDPVLQLRLTALKERLDDDARDATFIARFEEIRLEQSQVNQEESRFALEVAFPKMKGALHDYGIDIGVTDAARAVILIQGRPETVRVYLIAALHECLRRATADETQAKTWLIAVLDAGDGDSWRMQVRKGLAVSDWQDLEKLANQADVQKQPASFLTWLAISLPLQFSSTRVDLLRRSQQAYPGDFWVNSDLAAELLRAGKDVEAVRYYTAALALRPQNAGAFLNHGSALTKINELDAAIADFRQALALAPRYAMAHYNMGNALQDQGKLNEAIAAFRQAISIDPGLASAYNNMGAALKAQGDADGAITAHRRAIALGHRTGSTYEHLALALYAKGEVDEAIAAYREALVLDPRSVSAYCNLGVALGSKGDLEGAMAAYSQAISYDEKDAPANNNLALLLAESDGFPLRDPARAVELATKVVELSPENGIPWSTLGVARYRAGDWLGAITAFENSARLDKGGSPYGLYFRAMSHWQLGEHAEAREWYDRAAVALKGGNRTDERFRRVQVEAAALLGVKQETPGSQADGNQFATQAILKFLGTEEYETQSETWVRYRLGVMNDADFSKQLFLPAPDLPPIGLNQRASRTIVEIFDYRGKRLYGFVSLGKPSDLRKIHFARKKTESPPEKVYVVIVDRRLGRKVESNLVEILRSEDVRTSLPQDNGLPPDLTTAGPTIERKRADLLGQPAFPLAVQTWLNGEPLILEEMRGKIVLLDFWAVWCGPCIATFPTLTDWHDKYAALGLTIVGVTRRYQFDWDAESNRPKLAEGLPAEKEDAATLKFAQHHRLKHRLAVAEDDSLARQYGVTAIPRFVLVDKAGVIRLAKAGNGAEVLREIENEIRGLLGLLPLTMAAQPVARDEANTNVKTLSKDLQLVLSKSPKGPFRQGERIPLDFELKNVSGKMLAASPNKERVPARSHFGISQAYIERLGNDTTITAFSHAARDGRRYGAGGYVLNTKPQLAIGETLNLKRSFDTNDLPPGKYRYDLEYLPPEGAPQVVSYEFEVTASKIAPSSGEM